MFERFVELATGRAGLPILVAEQPDGVHSDELVLVVAQQHLHALVPVTDSPVEVHREHGVRTYGSPDFGQRALMNGNVPLGVHD